MNLIGAILRGTWMIDEQFAIGFAPLLQNILEGKHVDLSTYVVKSEVRNETFNSGPNGTDQSTIAIIPVKGVIMKEDYCGDMGMKSFNSLLQKLGNDPNISAIILELDTPGGEASFMPIVANTLREVREKKPVVGYVEGGIAASAGYYIASQCSQLFLGCKSDAVGSIGTMISFRSAGPKMKEMVVIHNIYATKSTDKNKAFHDAESGEYALIRTSMLDPLNEEFHAQVKLGRPDISKEVFTGKMYLAEEAQAQGMVDSVKTFDEVLQFTQELINNNTMGLFNKSSKMKNEKLSAILGRDVNAGEKLSQEDMNTISAHIIAQEDAAVVAESTIADLRSSNTELTTALETQRAEVVSLETMNERLQKLEGAAAASPANIAPGAAAEDVDYSDEPWADPNNPINKAAAEGMGI